MTSRLDKLRVYTLAALIIFLTLSAWLVSFFGSIWWSLGRDILLFVLIGLSLAGWKSYRKPQVLDWLIIAFIAISLLSFFNKQDSLSQWLRGERYLLEPFILLLTLRVFPLKKGSGDTLSKALVCALVLVLIGSVLDYFWPQTLRYTLHDSGPGFLGQVHLAGDAIRLQSLLAGPNALGLFLMTGLLLSPIWTKLVKRYQAVTIIVLSTAILALTYSRSSYLGLLFGLLLFFGLTSRYIKHSRLAATTLITVSLFASVAIVLTQPSDLIRTQSNTDRLTQYQRVWEQRSEIGLFGRGAGTAGLVSEYAFDGSTNYHSENSYLDVSENIGWLGGLVYLSIWIYLIIKCTKLADLEGKTLAAMLLGLAIAGLFIDHYTGQVAIWLVMIFAGGYLVLPQKK